MAEVLGNLIKEKQAARQWSGIQLHRMLEPITHSQFADDTILVREATVREARGVLEVIEEYSQLSGQEMNKAVPIYSMQCFHMSNVVGVKLDGLLKKFVWEGAKDQRRIPLINWDTLCMLKEDGGVGLRKMNIQNMALGAKLSRALPLGTFFGKSGALLRTRSPGKLVMGAGLNFGGTLGMITIGNLELCNRLEGIMRNRVILALEDEDCIFWRVAKSGEYNVKLGYEVQRHRVINPNWPSKLCWNNWILPKARAFLWIALHGRILTGDRLKTIGIHGPSWCVLCNAEEESVDHLLFNYMFAQKCWEWFLRMANLCTVRNGSLKEFLVSWPMFNQTKWGALWLVGPVMIVWLIWKERNK
ncbi:uncharacterized protein LOC131859007 [Cryptomeria japonica]|uniref:uncharacterized protein LOC131859007 n=1 Tax=Cryptomeria japonica TaxID=3369 RepID=UPI0027DA7035|nr:uncharacterized protein LOC131859007 [Cryptomeria japonica]